MHYGLQHPAGLHRRKLIVLKHVSARFRTAGLWLGLIATASLVSFCAPLIHAQESASISGSVTDPTGAVIPNADVTLTNTDTSVSRKVVANAAGLYIFTNLQPGPYSVSASATGFSTYNRKLVVTIGSNITLNASLTTGGTSTTVEVSATDAAQVNTSTPEVSQVITSTEVSELPSLTRNPYDFVALSGNVSAGDEASNGSVQNGASRGVGLTLNGQRNSGTEILLDGVENNSVFGDSVGIQVPIDAVQEYRVITNNFSPEYGRASGGVVSVATKSGTNLFHGRAWEFNRISATTSNTVTNAQTLQPKGTYTRNEFGGVVGGPIIKDKLFFFGGAEFTRVRSSAATISAVPSTQLLAAAPANVQSYFSTYSGPTSYRLVSQTSNLAAGGGTTSLYPTLPDATPVFNNVAYTAPIDAGGGVPQNTYNIIGRIDYNLGEKTQAFARYVGYNESDQSGSIFASPYTQYAVGASDKSQAYLLSVAHEFSSAFSTIGKLSYERFNIAQSYNTALQNVPTLFVAANATDPVTGKFFQFPGFFDTNPANGGLPFGGPQNTIQYNQELDYSVNRHQIQVGGQVLYIQMNNAYGAYAQAGEQLGSSRAKGLPAILTGNLYQFSAAVNPNGAYPCYKNQYTGVYTQTAACTVTLPATQPQFARSDRYHDWAAYAQDQFKMTSRFTVDYGVRYEYYGVQHNNKGSLDSNFVLGAGSSLPAQIRSGQIYTASTSPVGGLWHPQYGTVSPRIGFALDVFGNGRTSLRGGYGISYERNFGNVTFNVIQNPPNYAVLNLTTVPGTANTPIPVTNSNTGPLTGTGSTYLPNTSARWVDQNIRTSQTQFRSLSIDQRVGVNSVVTVSYNGARGIHLYDIKNYNGLGGGNALLGDPITSGGVTNLTRLNAQYGNMNQRGSGGDSYYDAVNVGYTTQDIHHSGLSIVANYTYGHATDDLSTTFSETSVSAFALGYTNPFNPALDHGNSDFDITHRLVIAPIYRTPSFFKDKGGSLAQLLGGYEITGIYTVRTGTPFTIYDSTYDASGYNVPRYNPVTPVTNHTFKSIPVGATNGGNSYQLTSGNGQTAGQSLPNDAGFYNTFYAPFSAPGISDWGPYPATMTARNSFRGPGAYNLNVSVSKSFPIYERLNLELRAEGFNVTNHHNLYIQEYNNDAANTFPGPPAIFASKGGINGGASDERRFLQFAGKINF